MKKITFILFGVFTLLLSMQAKAQCNYTLEMNDSWGDGWTGNTMDVLVDGSVVLDDVTLVTGLTGTMVFSVTDGADVTTVWNGGGSFGTETSYRILDFTNTEVGTGAESDITTGTITASCPSCTIAVVDTSTVVDDCGNSQYSVDVVFTSNGDATGVSDGTTTYPIVTGTATAGPFAVGSTQTLSVVHSDGTCDFSLGDFTDDCPTIVTCGTPVNTTYCYDDSDTTTFTYTSSDGSALNVTFNAGGIESCCDDVVILDSDGVTELYRGANSGDLAGLTFNSTGDTIIVAVDSDGSISCAGDASQSPQWDWDVTCLSCTPAVATVALVENCGASTYTLEVTVSDTGDASTITDGTTPQAIAASLTFGPYAFGTDITLDVTHSDAACDYTLGTYSFLGCPPANDDCSGAEVTTIPGSCTNKVISTEFATEGPDELPSCDLAGNYGVWYSFNGPASGQMEFTSGTGSPGIVIYEGTCGSLTEVAGSCFNNASGTITGLTSGAPYFAMVSTDTPEATVEFCLYSLACTSGVATASVTNDCNASTFTIDVDVTTLGDIVSVNDGTTSHPVVAGVNTLPVTYNFGDSITLTAEHADAACDFEIGTYSEAICPPMNIDCANATPIACGDTINTTSAGSTGTSEDIGCTNGSNGIWFTFTGTGYDMTVASTASFDHMQAIASGTCGSLVNIVCDDDSVGAESYTFTSVLNETYYVYIAHYSSSSTTTGTVNITLTCAPSCTPGVANATVVDDCIASTFTIDVDVTTLGDIVSVNDGTTSHSVVAGVNTLPVTYNYGDSITLTAEHSDSDCDFVIGTYGSACPPPPPACGGTFYDTGGPSGNYSASESTSTTISPDTSGDAVTITFTYVDIESSTGAGNQDGCWDYLTIYNGPDNTYPVLAQTLCGEESGDGGVPSVATSELNIGDSFTSTDASGALTIEFSSDSSLQETGWAADVTCATLSTQDYSINELFSYYPNPVTSSLTLKGQKTIQNVAVYNMLGQEVLRTVPNTVNSEIDMSALQSGAYFVKVTIENDTKTIRIIKN